VGDNSTPTKFSTWGAKAISGIGHVADTLMDRAIVLELRRKLPHEKVERIRYAEPTLFDDLRAKLARFAEDYGEQVHQSRPLLPDRLNDRAQDNWEPLLQIAAVAGDEWLRIGTAAAMNFSGSDTSTQTIGTELLVDIQEIFDVKRIDRISTTDLIESLCTDDEKPWATYNRGKSISPRQIANKLKGYGIQSKPIRIGKDVVKGYAQNQFDDAFSRYITLGKNSSSNSSFLSVTELQPASILDLRDFSSVTEPNNVTDENLWKPSSLLNCNRVTDRKPFCDKKNFFQAKRASETDPKQDDLREVTL